MQSVMQMQVRNEEGVASAAPAKALMPLDSSTMELSPEMLEALMQVTEVQIESSDSIEKDFEDASSGSDELECSVDDDDETDDDYQQECDDDDERDDDCHQVDDAASKAAYDPTRAGSSSPPHHPTSTASPALPAPFSSAAYSAYTTVTSAIRELDARGQAQRLTKQPTSDKVVGVTQIDLKTHKVIRTHETMKSAARAVGVSACCISRCCTGLSKSSKGFGWLRGTVSAVKEYLQTLAAAPPTPPLTKDAEYKRRTREHLKNRPSVVFSEMTINDAASQLLNKSTSQQASITLFAMLTGSRLIRVAGKITTFVEGGHIFFFLPPPLTATVSPPLPLLAPTHPS
jgi:hypothetical protein